MISLEHHEKWDGSGYPMGKQGEGIHIAARITALVDVFDALLSKRVYKDAWPLERVVAQILEQSGRHFDPLLVSLMMDSLERFVEIRGLHADLTDDAEDAASAD